MKINKDKFMQDILTELKKKSIKISKNINFSDRISDLNIDSIDLMDLVISLEDRYNVKVQDEKLLKVITVEDLFNLIND